MVLSHQQVAQAVPRCDIMTPQQKAIRSNNKKFTWPDGGQSPFRGEKTPVATGCRPPSAGLAWSSPGRSSMTSSRAKTCYPSRFQARLFVRGSGSCGHYACFVASAGRRVPDRRCV